MHALSDHYRGSVAWPAFKILRLLREPNLSQQFNVYCYLMRTLIDVIQPYLTKKTNFVGKISDFTAPINAPHKLNNTFHM